MENQIDNKKRSTVQGSIGVKKPEFQNAPTKVEISTFAKVRNSKASPVQTLMDKELPRLIGNLFLLDTVEEQEVTDPDTGEVHVHTLYTVKTLQQKAKAKLGTLIVIKVKDANPIVSQDKLMESILEGSNQKLIIRFTDIAHYSFIGGEAINAKSANLVNISAKEASKL